MKSTGMVEIIAEIGVNHDGHLEKAIYLTRLAADAGATAVKYQLFSADSLVISSAPSTTYQRMNIGQDLSQYQLLKSLELENSSYLLLKRECEALGVRFLCSGFDVQNLQFLHSLGMLTYKVPSGEIDNVPYLDFVATVAEQIILSTGMASLDDVAFSVNHLLARGVAKSRITLLQCTTQYPASFSEANLLAMITLKKRFGVNVGYSDHTVGDLASLSAVALGAVIIEKHFTDDKMAIGPDHQASMEYNEFKLMVSKIRQIEVLLGSYEKKPSAAELENAALVKKSIRASRIIKKGETFSNENLLVKRPGDGISPREWNNVLGLKATRNFSPDENIEI